MLKRWSHLFAMQGDGNLAYGIYVANGRLKGEVKKALRNVIERYELAVLITPNQNLILRGINPAWKDDIVSTLFVSCSTHASVVARCHKLCSGCSHGRQP